MVILGITPLLSYNQAACLLIDGDLISWSEEERYNRFKFSKDGDKILPPKNAATNCLRVANLKPEDIDFVSVGFSRLDEISRRHSPRFAKKSGYNDTDWCGAYPKDVLDSEYGTINWLMNEWSIEHLDGKNRARFKPYKIEWFDHHTSHVASSVIPSGFADTNYMSIDGDGGGISSLFGFWDGLEMKTVSFSNALTSFGLFYEQVTNALAFDTHGCEGKTMGLACYGKVDYELLPMRYREDDLGFRYPFTNNYNEIVANILDDDDFQKELKDFHEAGEGKLPSKRILNLAATGQDIFETLVIHNYENLLKYNDSKNLCLSGGSMLNCTTNGKLEKKVKGDIFIQPAAHDSGVAFGSAILSHKKHTNEFPSLSMNNAYHGSYYTDKEILDSLDRNGMIYDVVDPSDALAHCLYEWDCVMGYFNGKSEVGPRALCNRSILANPTKLENLQRVNRIKKREWWRPLAPVMPEEFLFEITNAKHKSPFMLMASEVKEEWRNKIPAVVHVDNSCRPQTVNRSQNKIIYDALHKFRQKTEVPVFMNTSFNVNEPLVNSPDQAIKTFIENDIDGLLISKYLIMK